MANFCCVRDEREIDELKDYDPMWPYPTIEIPNEGKVMKIRKFMHTYLAFYFKKKYISALRFSSLLTINSSATSRLVACMP